jgi:hypothetical protein
MLNRFRVSFQWLGSAEHGASKIFNVLPNHGVRLQARVLRNKPSDDSPVQNTLQNPYHVPCPQEVASQM